MGLQMNTSQTFGTDDAQSIDLKDILFLMISKLWLIILIAVLGAAAGFCYSKFVLPLEYSSHISMYVQSYTTFNENPDQNYNNINNSKQLINTYMEVLKDDAVLTAVGKRIEGQFDQEILDDCFVINSSGNITPASLRSCISIASVSDTSALKLTATTKSPEVSAAICNSMAKEAPEYLDKAVGVGSISTIDTAKVYPTPVAPNIPKNTAIGGMAGALLIMLIIFLVDFFDNTIRTTDWLGNRFSKAIIGEIQQFDGGKSRKKKRRKKTDKADDHIKLTDPDVPFSVVESYKSIRTNISFALSPYERKIFAVSSANPGEGKSTTSANIAIALAQGGNKVLLIDADLRKSVQHKIFGLKNKKGLSTAISRMHGIDECISRDVMENLDVMTAGPIPPNPSELLASASMDALLEKLSAQYNYIIIDTPPVNVVTDSMELAKNISGIIIVVRYAVSTTDEVETAMKKVEFSQMDMLGFILNDIKTRHAGKYYSKYKYGKGYYYKYGYGYYGKKPDAAFENDTEEDKPGTAQTKQDDPKSDGKKD